MEINDLPTNAAPTSDLKIELSDGNKATLASLPAPDSVTTLLAGKEASGAAATAQAFAIQRANHTGTQSADTLTDGTTNKAFLATERTKLAAISGTNTGDQDLSGLVVKSANLSDLTSAATARTNLGLGTLATQSGTFSGTSSGTNTGDQTIILTGDVTGSGTGSFAATVANDAVSNAKLANVATQTFKGRNTAGTGDPEDLSVATAKTMLNLTGTNTGDQTASTVANTPSGNISATTVQAAINELDAEKAPLASPALTGVPLAPTAAALTNSTQLATTAYADAADLAATAALIEREGLRFDGTNYAPITLPNTWSSRGFEVDFAFRYAGSTSSTLLGSSAGGLVIYCDGNQISINHQSVTNGGTWTLNSPATSASVLSVTHDGTGYKVLQNGTECVLFSFFTGTSTGNRWNYSGTISQPFSLLGNDLGAAYWNGSISRLILWNYMLSTDERSDLTRRGLVTLPEQRGGSMVAIDTQAGFTSTGAVNTFPPVKTGRKYRVAISAITLGTTPGLYVRNPNNGAVYLGPLTAIGNYDFTIDQSTGVQYALISGSGGSVSFTLIPLGTLFEQDSGQRNAGFMVRDTSGNGRHLELPENGVSVIDPADTGFIEYTRTTDGFLIGDRRVIPSTGYLVEVVATGNGTVTLGESAGTPANVCASVTLTSTPKILPLLVTQTSTGKLYVDLGTATTATFKIRLRAV